MNVSEAIRDKRAIRKFTEHPLSEDDIRAILNAGRRAQSSKNMQAWAFVVVTGKERLQRLSECGTYAGHIAGAAMAVAIVTPDPGARFNVMFDAGQAAAYLQLAAWELGIGSCLATIYEHDRAREILGFPADLHLRIAISFGYPEPAASRGGRRRFEEVVHREQWEQHKALMHPFRKLD